MTVVYGLMGGWLERYAAKELARYLDHITDQKQVVLSDQDYAYHDLSEQDQPIFLVGDNLVAQSLVEDGSIQIPSNLGEDGFLIKSARFGEAACLLLRGATPRGTLYAVYHYLEKYLKVGFFWDGEHIPKSSAIPFEGIDEVQIPRFQKRIYLGGGYTTFCWGWEEWKREVEWAVRKKLNILFPPSGCRVVWRKVLKEFGVAQEPPSRGDKLRSRQVRRITSFARRLGLTTISPGYSGEIGKPGSLKPPMQNMLDALADSASFIRAHPETEYRYFKWGATPPQTIIHPLDPMFIKFGKRILIEHKRAYGTDHLYFQGPPGESSIGATPEERRHIKVDMAKAMTKLLEDVDSEAVWLTDSWRFQDRKVWPKEDVRAFLDAIPDEKLLIYDTWADANPLYKELDYFFGKYWCFGSIHSFGGNTYLHGDLEDIISRAKDVASDPKANRCIGLTLAPEIIHHNHLYYDLLSKLAWNPADVNLDEFLHDYAMRRYGEEPTEAMFRCLKELSKSVYATKIKCNNDAMAPLYQTIHAHYVLGGKGITDEMLALWDKRKWFVLSLETALRSGLSQADRLFDHSLYRHDVIDITRQYLSELLNYRMMKLYRAFTAGDSQTFDAQAVKIRPIMDSLEEILSTDEYYYITPLIERARKLPHAGADIESRVKEVYTVWDRTSPSDWLVDYTRRDFYEVVKLYYRPRLEAFLKVLEEKMTSSNRQVSMNDFVHVFRHIEYSFVDKPLKVSPIPSGKDALKVATEIVNIHWIDDDERAELEEARARAEKIVQAPLRLDWDQMAA